MSWFVNIFLCFNLLNNMNGNLEKNYKIIIVWRKYYN